MRILVYLALDGGREPVPASILVETQRIPREFAYKILQKLGRAKIVQSFKGARGGFSLARKPEQISLLDVVEAIQGPLMIRPCLLADDACPMHPSCPVSAELMRLQEILESSMQDLTLAKIVSAKRGNSGRAAKNGS